ncbi:hypothetical protein V6N11_046281 [Hibiscus sabdariffa]|uniref:Uncharacterized protein n=2 Tax=Hibiscus sabdariffa TaxID=183260 RepID=A0ABR2A7Y8_9ROSI
MERECSNNPALNLIEGSRGRPPETIVNLAFLNPLERPDSPIPEDLQRDSKKGRNHEYGSVDNGSDISMLEIGNNSFDAPVEVTTATTVNNTMEVGQLIPMSSVQQTTGLKLSFRDIMAGEARSPNRSSAIEDLDVEVVNRKKKNSNTRKDAITSTRGSDAHGRIYGSRFNALATLENTGVQVDSHKGANLQSSVLPKGMLGSSLAHEKSVGSMVAETSLQGAQQGSEKGGHTGK